AGLADETGRVGGATMWAALDCPSGLAWITGPQPSGPAVLGRMAVAVHRRPLPGERLVVAGWPISAEGRKLLSGSAVWSADGEVLAVNAATWIRLSADQQAAFRVAGGS
ncbi:MAG TPA: hotdog fold domain-containing protein, partial [Acidimicrobiales bacterium]